MKATHEFQVDVRRRVILGADGWFVMLPFTARFMFSISDRTPEEVDMLLREFVSELPLEMKTRYRDVYAPEP